jgi:hypothetical protein
MYIIEASSVMDTVNTMLQTHAESMLVSVPRIAEACIFINK